MGINMTESVSGGASCLCGNIKITAYNINPKFSVCHCDTCRKWGGGPFFAVQCGTDVTIEDNQKLKVFDSSPWAERGFCSDCGTHLFYKFKKTGQYNMPLGIFPKFEHLEMNIQYFSDQKPAYYCFKNETKEMTAAEIMVYFSSSV